MPVQTDTVTPWVLATEPDPSATMGGTAMIVDGHTFCVSAHDGDIDPRRAHGLFVADTRVVSGLRLTINGHPLELLATFPDGAMTTRYVGRTAASADGIGHRMVVLRRRTLSATMTEDIELRNHADRDLPAVVLLMFESDFADVFTVKEGRSFDRVRPSVHVDEHTVTLRWSCGSANRTALLSFDGEGLDVHSDHAAWTITVPAHGRVRVHWNVLVEAGTATGHLAPLMAASSETRVAAWIRAASTVRSARDGLSACFTRSVADIASLRLVDDSEDRRPAIAAGAPWFMTLFGRDSLLSAYMALPCDPTLALGVLEALAELQGSRTDDLSEEEPGRILHELRFLHAPTFELEEGTPYYGSVDATPLFVVLLAELSRWGLPEDELVTLLPSADRALAWVEGRIDQDPRGLLAYHCPTEHGLVNQGWKDSWDGIRFADGAVATAPLALSEVQGYVYAAFIGRADIADRLEDATGATRWRAKAAAVRARFDQLFWMEDLGRFATAIGPDGEHVDSNTTNIGHCLWTGIVDPARSSDVARALCSPAMWTGWGLRTLAADEHGYDPLSYHCGSVWPHDSAICAAGLARYGHVAEAAQIIRGLVDASTAWGGRLPELITGLDHRDSAQPVPYPTSCSPQAWAAAAPVLSMRTIFGLEPDLGRGTCRIARRVLPGFEDTDWVGLQLWDRRLTLRAEGGSVFVEGAAGLDVVRDGPR